MEWMARTNPAPFASWKRYAEPPLQFDHRFEPVLAACTKASKTYSTRQHLTAPEIVFFWFRFLASVLASVLDGRCEVQRSRSAMQKMPGYFDSAKRVWPQRGIPHSERDIVISMRCSHVHVRHGVNFDERWTTQVISARFAEKAEHQHQS